MKKGKKKSKRVVNELYDTEVEFVSLVKHGANQTPFKVVKVLDLCKTDNSSKSAELLLMDETKKLLEKKGADETVDVQSMLFSGSKFPTAKEVTAYLVNKGYSDFEVATHETGFIVTARPEADFEELSQVEAKKGVTIVMGKVKESIAKNEQATKEAVEKDAPAEDTAVVEVPADEKPVEESKTEEVAEAKDELEETAEKTEDAANKSAAKSEYADTAAKYDSFSALFSQGKTIQDVMKDGYDGFPPAFFEVSDAMVTAMRNALLSNDTTAVKALVKEYGQIVIKLDAIFSALDSADGVDGFAAKLLDTPKEEASKSEETVETDVITEEPAKEEIEAPAASTEEPAQAEKSESAPEALAQLIAAEIAKALAPMVEKLNEVSAKSTEALSVAKSEIEAVKVETEERVSNLENKNMTRKSGSEIENEVETAKKAFDEKEYRQEIASKRLASQINFMR